MLQEGGLYPGVRPLEALTLFAAFYPDADDPERLLDLVGLREVSNTYVRRLSGGECQRLSLALALIGRPEVVFLDEPTAGMDPRARPRRGSSCASCATRAPPVVLTTHHMDEAEHLCDRLAIIDHGRIVSEGSPADITNVGGDDVRFATTAGIDLPALAAALSLDTDTVHEARPGEYSIRTEMSPELVADLAVWLRDKGYGLTELRTERATLEEVFLQLTREDDE